MSRLAKIYAWITRGSLLWIVVALLFSIGWIYSGGLFEADFKAGEPEWYWMTLSILVLSIPLATGIAYLSSWAERLCDQKKYVVPSAVFWLWSVIIVCALLIAGLSWVLYDGYRFYGEILRRLYFPLVLAYVGGAGILWFIPHTPRWYPRIVVIFIGIIISFTLVLGLVSQRSSFGWFFALSPEKQEMMQGRQRTVTVNFREGVSTEEWEQYLAETNWSVFGYRVSSARVRIIRCTGEELAEVNIEDNLERVRESFQKQVSEIAWYDSCVSQMMVRGEIGNEFERAMESQPGLGQLVDSIDRGEFQR